jgi:hypothetical protein
MKWLPLLTGIALLATACASGSDEEASAPAPDPAPDPAMARAEQINCATAEADVRVLRSEQRHAMERAMGGGTTMVPSGLVTEPEFGTNPIGAGQYSDYINDRIQRIQEACGL